MELLEHVKASTPETFVILMTAYATIDNAVEAMKKGADSYFVKGNDPDELVTEILGLYESKRRRSAHGENTGDRPLIPTSKNKAYTKCLEMAKKRLVVMSIFSSLGNLVLAKKFLQNIFITKADETIKLLSLLTATPYRKTSWSLNSLDIVKALSPAPRQTELGDLKRHMRVHFF